MSIKLWTSGMSKAIPPQRTRWSAGGCSGRCVLRESGRLVVLDNASISRVDDPAAEDMDHRVTTLEEILASAPGPNIDGGST